MLVIIFYFKPSGIIYSKKNTAKGKTEKKKENKSKGHVFFFLVEIGAKRPIKLNAAELIQSDHNTNYSKDPHEGH